MGKKASRNPTSVGSAQNSHRPQGIRRTPPLTGRSGLASGARPAVRSTTQARAEKQGKQQALQAAASQRSSHPRTSLYLAGNREASITAAASSFADSGRGPVDIRCRQSPLPPGQLALHARSPLHSFANNDPQIGPQTCPQARHGLAARSTFAAQVGLAPPLHPALAMCKYNNMPAGAQAAAADGDIMISWTSRSLSLVLAAARSRPGLIKVRTCTHETSRVSASAARKTRVTASQA